MRLQLQSKILESGDVWSFFFKTDEPLIWKAGQSIRLEVPRRTWGYDERRFTISSAPYEKILRITTRISGSEFKQNLHALKPGDAIDGHNIEGNFTWEESGQPKLLLAAGIGITPFRSMLADRIKNDKPLNTTMLYGSTLQPAVYAGELLNWSTEEKDFNLLMTDRRIGMDTITHQIPDWQGYLIYISGPEQMVLEISRQLINAGFNQNYLRQDFFTGNILS